MPHPHLKRRRARGRAERLLGVYPSQDVDHHRISSSALSGCHPQPPHSASPRPTPRHPRHPPTHPPAARSLSTSPEPSICTIPRSSFFVHRQLFIPPAAPRGDCPTPPGCLRRPSPHARDPSATLALTRGPLVAGSWPCALRTPVSARLRHVASFLGSQSPRRVAIPSAHSPPHSQALRLDISH